MEIPNRRYMHWDGKYKKFTADCTNCNWYRRIQDKNLCGFGVAFKYLSKTGRIRKCEVKNRKLFFNHSVQYLDEIIRELNNGE